jgi:SAM-dependent methyltransferase
MEAIRVRACPLCGGEASRKAFPYAIEFSDQVFRYYRCNNCRSVFVNPIPDEQSFANMYDKAIYHDTHYGDVDSVAYAQSVSLLRRYISPGSSVLDYGCGIGLFLKEAKHQGFQSYGIEFDSSAASVASEFSGCTVSSLAGLDSQALDQRFDVIHIGDVLEHLPDPFCTLSSILQWLKPHGLLFVEGPLETNPSPVYWAARMFGGVKHRLRPSEIGAGVPTHLFRTSAPAQSRFFRQRFPALRPLFWQVLESGWPYAEGNWIKRGVAAAAITLGGRTFAGIQLGNRFQALYSFP